MAQSRPLKVVLLLQELAFGGTQRQALELAAGLDRARFCPEIWCLMAGDDFLPEARARCVKVRYLGRAGYVWPDALFRLGLALRREKPDILYMLTGIPNLWGRFLGRYPGRPLLVGSWRGTGCPGRQAERLFWPLADHFICNAAMLKQRMIRERGIPPERISVIANGVDTERFKPRGWAGKIKRVLNLARLVPEKDQALLIRAFAGLVRDHSEMKLTICGDGPLKAELQSLAAKLLPPGSWEIIPGRAGLEELLTQDTVLALSSRAEGLPNVLLEALASGLAVAATRAGGVAEIVSHNVEGLLSEPGDAAGLRDNLRALLAGPGLCARLGRAGRQKAENEFSLSRMCAGHERIFAELAGKKGIAC